MVILLVFASIVGGALTFATLLPFGVLLALVGAPLGGSLLAGGVAVALALTRNPVFNPGLARVGTRSA